VNITVFTAKNYIHCTKKLCLNPCCLWGGFVGNCLKQLISLLYSIQLESKGKGKAVPLQAWSGPEGSRKLMFPDYMTMAQDGVKVVSLTHQPPLPPGNAPGTHFC
jgi:hypothetical protein